MDLPSATLLLQAALGVYVGGVVGSLFVLRQERIANLVGLVCATVAGALFPQLTVASGSRQGKLGGVAR
ncbi:MAG: hypothetical protein WCQ21_07880 [Verrucomicrobiota bacterium]|jgi:hypothetical protein